MHEILTVGSTLISEVINYRFTRVSVMVNTLGTPSFGPSLGPGMPSYIRFTNLAVNIIDCVSLVGRGSYVVVVPLRYLHEIRVPPHWLCLSDRTLQTVGLFYMVSLPGK